MTDAVRIDQRRALKLREAGLTYEQIALTLAGGPGPKVPSREGVRLAVIRERARRETER